MAIPRTIIAGLFILALSACQTMRSSSVPPEGDVVALQVAIPKEAKAFRAFVEARLRLAEGDFAGAAALLAQVAESNPTNAQLRLLQAEVLLQAGAEQDAIRVAEDALNLNPRETGLALFLGNYYFNREENDKAIAYFQQAYDIDAADEAAGFHLALAVAKTGDYRRSAELLMDMLKRKPDFVGVELMLARVYREMDQDALAEETLRKTLERNPDLETPYLELGALYESRNERSKAFELYRLAIGQMPENTVLRQHLARLLVQEGKLEDARGELEAILRFRPDDLEARRKIGLIHLEQKRYPEAVTVFNSILENAPDLYQVRFYLGSAYERMEKLEEGLAHFEMIPASSELYGDALSHRSYLLHKLKRTDEATALLESALEQSYIRPEHFFFLQAIYESQQNYAAADQVVAKLARRFPEDAEIAYRVAIYHERRGRQDEALVWIRRAIEIAPAYAEALNYLAYFYAEKGENLQEALELAQKAIKLKPEGHIFDTLGWVYFQLGDYARAKENLEKANSLIDNDPVVLEHLGDALRALKSYNGAAEMYRQSLDEQPDNPALREKLQNLPKRVRP